MQEASKIKTIDENYCSPKIMHIEYYGQIKQIWTKGEGNNLGTITGSNEQEVICVVICIRIINRLFIHKCLLVT